MSSTPNTLAGNCYNACMTKHNHFRMGSVEIIALVILVVAMFSLLGWVFWQKLEHTQPSADKDTSSDPVITHSQGTIIFPRWDLQLPLSTETSGLTVDSFSFSGNDRMGSYGIFIKDGSGCWATPDYVATILRVVSAEVIVKPESPLANTRHLDGYYGKTWREYYHDKLAENQDGTKLTKDTKEIDDYTYVLQYLPSRCAAADPKIGEEAVNQLRDRQAAALKDIFQDLELPR